MIFSCRRELTQKEDKNLKTQGLLQNKKVFQKDFLKNVFIVTKIIISRIKKRIRLKMKNVEIRLNSKLFCHLNKATVNQSL